jgi:hypothetical protein
MSDIDAPTLFPLQVSLSPANLARLQAEEDAEVLRRHADRAAWRGWAQHLEILKEELADFTEGHAEESGGDREAWVPLRLLPITGLVAGELARARMIELAGDCARPLSGETR